MYTHLQHEDTYAALQERKHMYSSMKTHMLVGHVTYASRTCAERSSDGAAASSINTPTSASRSFLREAFEVFMSAVSSKVSSEVSNAVVGAA